MDLSGLPAAILSLSIDFIKLAKPNVILGFRAAANVSYTLEHVAALGEWQTLQTFPAAPTNRIIEVSRPASEPARFYQLRSP
jgi:hypothetical protein